MFTELSQQWLTGVHCFHMVDESLIQDTIRHGSLRRVTMRRLLSMVDSAAESGADAILVTCSSIGPAVALAQQVSDIPVIRIDEAMAAQAVRSGRRIGVVATLRTTLEPTLALLQSSAAAAGRSIELTSSLCEGAFDAVLAGDTATHDAILTRTLTQEMRNVDLIVLAQASMARVVKQLPVGMLTIPVLSSPELAVKSVAAILQKQGVGNAAASFSAAAVIKGAGEHA
jgi:Asp/Glu/hydantoin racemase